MSHTNNKEVAKAVERIADKVNEYARQHYLVSEESHPVADEMKAWDDLIDTLHQELQKAREQWLREVLHTVDRINISTEIEFIQPKDQYGYYRCQEDIKKAIQK